MHVEKIKHHIDALRTKHLKLDQQIESMEATGSYEDTELHILKKQRLALKDEITQFEHQIEAS